MYPVRWTAQRALYVLPPWQTCSFRHQLGFSGKHSSDAVITRKFLRATTKSLPFLPLSIARYSFIQLSQLERTEMPNLRNGTKGGIRTRAHFIVSPSFYQRPSKIRRITRPESVTRDRRATYVLPCTALLTLRAAHAKYGETRCTISSCLALGPIYRRIYIQFCNSL